MPIPLLAATGLSIPLPGTVERIAASLVAWVDAGPLDRDAAFVGSIVRAPGEPAALQGFPEGSRETARRTILGLAGPPTAVPADAGGGGTTRPKEKDKDGGDGGSTPDPGGGDPGDEPGLVEGTVKEVTETPLVEEVDKTLGELLPKGDDESSSGVLDDTLSGLGLGG